MKILSVRWYYQSFKYSLTITSIFLKNTLAHSLMIPNLNRYLITSLEENGHKTIIDKIYALGFQTNVIEWLEAFKYAHCDVFSRNKICTLII